MSQSEKKYMQRMLVSMIFYLGLTYGSVWILKNQEIAHVPLKILIAVMPMVPLVWAYRAIIAHVRSMDEFQRKIQFEAVVFAAVITGFVAGTYGFLQNAGLPPLDVIWIMPMLITLWGVGGFIARRKYL